MRARLQAIYLLYTDLMQEHAKALREQVAREGTAETFDKRLYREVHLLEKLLQGTIQEIEELERTQSDDDFINDGSTESDYHLSEDEEELYSEEESSDEILLLSDDSEE
jgi:hypothetical protein